MCCCWRKRCHQPEDIAQVHLAHYLCSLCDLESAVVSLIFDLLLFVYSKHQHQQHNSPVFQIDFVSKKQHPLHHDTHMGVDGTDYVTSSGRRDAPSLRRK